MQRLGPADPRYPASLSAALGVEAAPELSFVGQPDILAKKKLALFSSRQCPGSLIIKAQDLTQELRRSDLAVIGGFQSPVEKECLAVLLRSPAPVILCPARNIDRMKTRPEWRIPLDAGRLLVLSRSPAYQRRPTAQLAAERNRLVVALADVVFVSDERGRGAQRRWGMFRLSPGWLSASRGRSGRRCPSGWR